MNHILLNILLSSADGPTTVFIAGRIGHLYMIGAILILLFFYAIYFIKMIAQKRRGIQTRQLGKGKDKNIRTVEILISVTTLLIVPAQLLSIFLEWNLVPDAVRIIGSIIGFVGDLIFLTAVVTMRDSWRAGIPSEDKTELILDGIYKYSRNPAFLGFDLMYIGILLMYFNWILLVITILTVISLHLQILQEEKFLAAAFGEEYITYKQHTFRYLGRRK